VEEAKQADRVAPEDPDAILELDDDAIIAQEAPAHAPPRRWRARKVVRRSIVIRERGWADATVVVGKHRLEGEERSAWKPLLTWVVTGIGAFACGGVLAVWLSPAPEPAPAAIQPKPPASSPAAAPPPPPASKIVSVTELPVEARRSGP